jgi:putative ABC transport system permease protein
LKAIGAKNSTILGLFLFEALLIGIMGASLGLVAGIGMGYLLASASPGGGGGGEDNAEGGTAAGSSPSVGDPDNSGTANSEPTGEQSQESEPLTPVYLGVDMMRVWFISVGLSVMAGLYPAWKASRYLPVDALRSL